MSGCRGKLETLEPGLLRGLVTALCNVFLFSVTHNCNFHILIIDFLLTVFSSDQLLSHVWLFTTPWTAAHQASPSITNSCIESVMTSNHLILCRPLLLPPSLFPSIRVFSDEPVLHIRWPKYWSFSFNISPSNEYPGLISFRMDCLDLLVVQGTLKSLFQHHNSKASVLQCLPFFVVKLSNPYMTTEKTIAFTRWTFVGKVMLAKLFICCLGWS